MPRNAGYARPRIHEPGIEAQVAELAEAGAETVFSERMLSKEADRPELRRALDSLAAGDALIVVSLDRLARTPTELFYILEEIIARGAVLRSLREGLTLGAESTPHASNDHSFMRHLGMIIDFERAMLSEWQRESIDAAKLRRETGASRRRR